MDLVFVSGVSSGIGAALKDHLQGQVTVAGFARSTIDLPHSLAVDLAKPASWPKVIDWMNQVITEVAPAEMGFFHCAATLDPLGFAGSVDSGGYADNVLLNSASPQVLGAGFVGLARELGIPATLMLISSGAANTPYAGLSSYGAAKAACDQWVRAVGLELASSADQIRVLSVAPGVVETRMQQQIRSMSEDSVPQVERFRRLEADGILTTPHDTADRLWSVMRDQGLASGSVLDLRTLG